MMRDFKLVSIDNVKAVVRRLPQKLYETDPIPTRLLKEHIEVFAPFSTALLNASLSQGVVPASFKAAYIMPPVKKLDLDPADVKTFCNLSVLFKLSECVTKRLLLGYLGAYRLLPDLRPAYRGHH